MLRGMANVNWFMGMSYVSLGVFNTTHFPHLSQHDNWILYVGVGTLLCAIQYQIELR